MKILLLLVLVANFSFAASSLFEANQDKAFAHAKKTGKPMLIDFYGIWCPPCNQLDETVFNQPAFIERAKAFSLLKVDADAPASWKLKDRYKIGGYPTILFTDSKGKEIDRVVGYRGLTEFTRMMDQVLASKSKSFEVACKSKDTDDLWRCAMVLWDKKDKKGADAAFLKLAGKIDRASIRYDLAKQYAVENSANEDLKRKGYEDLMIELPASPLALGWAHAYLGTFDAAAATAPNQEVLQNVIAQTEKAKADPRREQAGVIETDLAQYKASLLRRMGKIDESKKAFKEAADLFHKLGESLPADVSRRGYAMEEVYCLESAGESEKALALSGEYRAKYPQEFTFHFETATILKKLKRFNDAIPVADKAFQTGYGDNKIRAAILLIQLYATVPNKDAARKVYEAVAAEKKPGKLEVRTHRYLKALDDAWGQLQKA